MNRTVAERRELVAAVAVAAAWGLLCVGVWLNQRRSSRVVPGNLPGFVSSITDQVYAAAQIEAAADVVVTRRLDGQLVVKGRAVKNGPLLAKSPDDLRRILRDLQHPGMGVVNVELPPGKGSKDPLLGYTPPEIESARQAIIAVLAEHGFRGPSGTSTKRAW